uniref:Inner membrane component domain-containing protein n=2 Tax=Magallana gigas TaxID=29159 RepID=K1PLP8_MAGGI
MGKGEGGAGILWAFLWFLILIFLGWPIGFFIAWLYVLLLPFGACIAPIKDVNQHILGVVQLPLTCAENMIAMKPLC